MESFTEHYQKYKWFFTSTGILVIGGKSAAQNDTLLESVLNAQHEYMIMHTHARGSPFTVRCAPVKELNQQSLLEAAIFTASFSQAWKQGKREALVDMFKSTQIHKNPTMKAGTWGVYGTVQKLKVPLQLALTRQKGILRAVPLSAVKGKKKRLLLSPGSITKDELLPKVELELDEALCKEEVLQAVPAGNFKVHYE